VEFPPQRDEFGRRYRRGYAKALAILEKNWDRMVTFYHFPEEHWRHLRTTNWWRACSRR
jgi:transposase-like protein